MDLSPVACANCSEPVFLDSTGYARFPNCGHDNGEAPRMLGGDVASVGTDLYEECPNCGSTFPMGFDDVDHVEGYCVNCREDA